MSAKGLSVASSAAAAAAAAAAPGPHDPYNGDSIRLAEMTRVGL